MIELEVLAAKGFKFNESLTSRRLAKSTIKVAGYAIGHKLGIIVDLKSISLTRNCVRFIEDNIRSDLFYKYVKATYVADDAKRFILMYDNIMANKDLLL